MAAGGTGQTEGSWARGALGCAPVLGLGGFSPSSSSSRGCLLLRGAAFPQGLPPIHCDADFRLLPLIAQQNGYYSADARTWLQAAACADVHEAALQPTLTLSGAGKLLARRIKHTLLSRKEGDE